MGPTPILEMARAYGLRPRLWLLVPESSLEKFSMLNVPFLNEVLPFGKPKNGRIQVITDGG